VIVVSSGSIYAPQRPSPASSWPRPPIPNGGKGGPPQHRRLRRDGTPEVARPGRASTSSTSTPAATFTKLWSAATDDDLVAGDRQLGVRTSSGDGRNEVVYNDEVYIRIYPGVEPDCQLKPPRPLPATAT
jgi:hypothetical protein